MDKPSDQEIDHVWAQVNDKDEDQISDLSFREVLRLMMVGAVSKIAS